MTDLQLQNCRLSERYSICSLLGRGSYAEIYAAKDDLASPQSPHEMVAIKALNVFMQNDLDHDLERTLVENFQNEAISLDEIRHPNIISRLGHGTARDMKGTVFHYIVLEYMAGGDLSGYCRNRKLTVAECLKYLEQICAGISHAHKKDVIHRDIKPQNLLLTEDKNVVKVADFGVARFGQSETPITRVGTNVYAPPEHSPMLSGETQNLPFPRLTPAADVYSIAKSAYALFTSESPKFSANHPITELPHAYRRQPWAKDLIKILNRATQNDPRNRHRDVNDFWADLSKLSSFDDEISISTRVSSRTHPAPQPQFAKGYSPNIPLKPKFDTSRDLKPKPHLTVGQNPPLVVEVNRKNPIMAPKSVVTAEPLPDASPLPLVKKPGSFLDNLKSSLRGRLLRAFAVSMILIGLVGSLYATYNYFLTTGFSIFGITASRRVGTAVTDINLRSAPRTTGTRIGLVTRNSRVEVVKIENNWYQIVIVEHGRPQGSFDEANRGWAYGRFIQLDE